MQNGFNHFSMGSYGVYVWGAYGVAVAVLIMNSLLPHKQQKKQINQQRHRWNHANEA